ncbi:hypothetical protein BKA69DRAFT_1165114 [Paraphysoderma sedebokerense]|nr:hypothetical protein BKA69DRAFT_1165114 [Paraphysoderma sedebokerense]
MDFLRCRGLPFFIFVIIFLGIAIRPIESINPVSSAWNERNRTLTSRVTSSSVDANSNARNVASVSTNFLSDLGKSILNNWLWKREQRNITGYDIIIKDPQKYITGEALPAVIVGGIGPLLVILMLITTIVFCSCRYCCNGCGGRNPYKYGYTNAQIWSINILTITTTGLIVFVGAMVIVLSSDLTTAFSSIKTEMNALLTDAAGVFPKLIDGFYQSAETIDTNVGLLGDLIEGYDVANKVNDIFMPTFNNFSSQLTYLSVNLTNARMSCASSDSLIAQISISRASIVTQLGTIRLQIDSLRSVSIQSTVYSINNVPDSNELADARYPSFSIFPNLTQYSARLDDTPNIASILSSAQNTVSNLTNDIPSKFKQQISSVLPQNPGDFLREAAGPIQPSADNIRNQLYNLSNDTDKAIDKYLISGDRIRCVYSRFSSLVLYTSG